MPANSTILEIKYPFVNHWERLENETRKVMEKTHVKTFPMDECDNKYLYLWPGICDIYKTSRTVPAILIRYRKDTSGKWYWIGNRICTYDWKIRLGDDWRMWPYLHMKPLYLLAWKWYQWKKIWPAITFEVSCLSFLSSFGEPSIKD